MSPAIIKHHPLAVDARGEFFELPPEAAYFLLKRVSGGRPAIIYYNGQPATVDINATLQDVIKIVNRVCTIRGVIIDADGNIIPNVPAAILEITAEDLGITADLQHWLRIDRIFDAFDRSMTAMESKDMLIAKTTTAIVESHTALQQGAVQLLEAANQTISVASGVSRPELNFDAVAERMYRTVKDAEQEHEPARAPLSVQLLNGGFGQAALTLVCGWAGIEVPDIHARNTDEVTE